MPKQTKSDTATKQTKMTASTPSTPAKSEKTATPVKSSKKKETVAAAPVASAPVKETVAAVEPTAVVSEVVSPVTIEFGEFATKLQQLRSMISSVTTEFRALEKKAVRELKIAAKATNKRKRKTGQRQPSGFVKPTLISDELATFLGKTKGSQMARTEVTREINAYIREHQLQDKTNGRRIIADTKLSSLLKLSESDELTYFNLQRFMSPHFFKNPVVAPVATA
jgi:chromatin remodeling complex protein RSC6